MHESIERIDGCKPGLAHHAAAKVAGPQSYTYSHLPPLPGVKSPRPLTPAPALSSGGVLFPVTCRLAAPAPACSSGVLFEDPATTPGMPTWRTSTLASLPASLLASLFALSSSVLSSWTVSPCPVGDLLLPPCPGLLGLTTFLRLSLRGRLWALCSAAAGDTATATAVDSAEDTSSSKTPPPTKFALAARVSWEKVSWSRCRFEPPLDAATSGEKLRRCLGVRLRISVALAALEELCGAADALAAAADVRASGCPGWAASRRCPPPVLPRRRGEVASRARDFNGVCASASVSLDPSSDCASLPALLS